MLPGRGDSLLSLSRTRHWPADGHVSQGAVGDPEHAGQLGECLGVRVEVEDVVRRFPLVLDFVRELAPAPGLVADPAPAALLDQLAQRDTPLCGSCGAIPKPDVVLFGELLPVGPMARAERLAGEAGLLLVVGTTLEVWPVGGLPERTKSAGGAVAIVNRGPTAFDESADLRIEGGAGVVLTALLDVLESQPI